VGAAGIDLNSSINDTGCWGGTVSKKIAVGAVYNSDGELYWDGYRELTKVQSLDEVLIVVKKSVTTRFDNHINGFHFYGIDFVLQARKDGYNVFAADLPITHHGEFSCSVVKDRTYWKLLRQLYLKWRNHYVELLTTHMHWDEHGEITSYIGFKIKSDAGQEAQIIGIKMSGVK
jgi:hypothetical protein